MRATIMLGVLVSLASVTHAEKPMIAHDEPRTWSRLGSRIGTSVFSIGGTPMLASEVSLTIDRSLFGEWRVVGEYEFLFFGRRDFDAYEDLGVAALPYTGHRVHAGVRRQFAQQSWLDGRVRVVAELDAGIGAMCGQGERRAIGAPHVYAGLRAAFAVDSGDQLWEYEVIVRGLALPDGVGALLGIGLVWGE